MAGDGKGSAGKVFSCLQLSADTLVKSFCRIELIGNLVQQHLCIAAEVTHIRQFGSTIDQDHLFSSAVEVGGAKVTCYVVGLRVKSCPHLVDTLNRCWHEYLIWRYLLVHKIAE